MNKEEIIKRASEIVNANIDEVGEYFGFVFNDNAMFMDKISDDTWIAGIVSEYHFIHGNFEEWKEWNNKFQIARYNEITKGGN